MAHDFHVDLRSKLVIFDAKFLEDPWQEPSILLAMDGNNRWYSQFAGYNLSTALRVGIRRFQHSPCIGWGAQGGLPDKGEYDRIRLIWVGVMSHGICMLVQWFSLFSLPWFSDRFEVEIRLDMMSNRSFKSSIRIHHFLRAVLVFLRMSTIVDPFAVLSHLRQFRDHDQLTTFLLWKQRFSYLVVHPT